MRNLEASKRADFVDNTVAELEWRNIQYFRIGESGDFYSQEYLDKWFEIARRLPGIRFLAFTKSWHLDFSKKPENLVIIWSLFPDSKRTGIPHGARAYAGACKGRANWECPGNCDLCFACWHSDSNFRVHFRIH